jgi:iron complex transport system permease protein
MKGITEQVKTGRHTWLFILAGAAALTGLVFVFSISIGHYQVPFGRVVRILLAEVLPLERNWSNAEGIAVAAIRLPRTLAALLIGSALSVAGAAYQGLFKNPMISPDILGVSSGASVGAALAILLGAGLVWVELGAFFGGLVAVSLTMLIPRLVRNDSIVILVLAGIIVGGLSTSCMSVIRMVSDPSSALADIVFWTMGSLARAKMRELLVVGPVMVICLAALLLFRYRLNVLSLGDKEAQSLGINVGRARIIVITASTLLTACSVSIAGTIGWVGLVIPHISRMLVGPDNKKMLPLATFIGGIFMMIIDILSRTLASMDIPLGVLTGLIGTPFFFFILLKQRRSLW